MARYRDYRGDDPLNDGDDYQARPVSAAGAGILRVALLFGSAAVALALIAAPLADRGAKAVIAGTGGVDTMTTGSINEPGRYTVRKSVLQGSPNAVCIIRQDGAKSGDC
ncbi:MAG: hypothetical protein ACRECW_20245 [Phyllobacterium sp.]